MRPQAAAFPDWAEVGRTWQSSEPACYVPTSDAYGGRQTQTCLRNDLSGVSNLRSPEASDDRSSSTWGPSSWQTGSQAAPAAGLHERMDDTPRETQRLFAQARTLAIAQAIGRGENMVLGARFGSNKEAKEAKMDELLRLAADLEAALSSAWLPVKAASPSVLQAVYGDSPVAMQGSRTLGSDALAKIPGSLLSAILPESIWFLAQQGLITEETANALIWSNQKTGQERSYTPPPPPPPPRPLVWTASTGFRHHVPPPMGPSWPPSGSGKSFNFMREQSAPENCIPGRMVGEADRLGYYAPAAEFRRPRDSGRDEAMNQLLAIQASHFRPPKFTSQDFGFSGNAMLGNETGPAASQDDYAADDMHILGPNSSADLIGHLRNAGLGGVQSLWSNHISHDASHFAWNGGADRANINQLYDDADIGGQQETKSASWPRAELSETTLKQLTLAGLDPFLQEPPPVSGDAPILAGGRSNVSDRLPHDLDLATTSELGWSSGTESKAPKSARSSANRTPWDFDAEHQPFSAWTTPPE